MKTKKGEKLFDDGCEVRGAENIIVICVKLWWLGWHFGVGDGGFFQLLLC